MAGSIVTLTTDFGSSDHYVGVMKGAILNVNPEVNLIDICNDIRPYDVPEGAFAIAQAYRYFPPRTIHLVLVDPGVGSSRRPLLVTAGSQSFIAPDNGILSLIYAREQDATVYHITASRYFLEPVSNTFHGRDVFAPVAGWLSRHVEPAQFGDPITDFARFSAPQPKKVNDRLLQGVVLRVDRFGTLLTNLTPADLPQLSGKNPPSFRILAGKSEVTKLNSAYSDGAPGEVFAIWGSSGHLEIAANQASASQSLGMDKGTEVEVILG